MVRLVHLYITAHFVAGSVSFIIVGGTLEMTRLVQGQGSAGVRPACRLVQQELLDSGGMRRRHGEEEKTANAFNYDRIGLNNVWLFG